jgi:hypothetical protein
MILRVYELYYVVMFQVAPFIQWLEEAEEESDESE